MFDSIQQAGIDGDLTFSRQTLKWYCIGIIAFDGPVQVDKVQELIRQVGLAPTKAKNICSMSKVSFQDLEETLGRWQFSKVSSRQSAVSQHAYFYCCGYNCILPANANLASSGAVPAASAKSGHVFPQHRASCVVDNILSR